MVSNPDLLFKTLKMGELLVKEDLLKAAIWVPVEVKLLTTTYRKVASTSMSRLVAHFQIFIRLMKGKFDAYVL